MHRPRVQLPWQNKEQRRKRVARGRRIMAKKNYPMKTKLKGGK